MEDNKEDRMFPGLRRGMMLTFVGIAVFMRYACYLLCAVFLYLLYSDFEKAKKNDIIPAFVITAILAILMLIIERLFKKNIKDLS
jgi:nitrate reductase gamma subunit